VFFIHQLHLRLLNENYVDWDPATELRQGALKGTS
jgi:hypothetical protein